MEVSDSIINYYNFDILYYNIKNICKNNKDIDQEYIINIIKILPNIYFNKTNCYGDTLLIWACSNNFENIASILITKMSIEYITKINSKGCSALHWCAINNMKNIIIQILQKIGYHHSILQIDIKGYSLFHWLKYHNLF